MNLKEAILAEHSKSQTDKIVKWVGKNQDRFYELYKLFLSGEYRVTQRAAWPLSYVVKNYPILIKKHFSSFITNLEQPGNHDAVKRNSLRILEDYDIPAKYQGRIMDLCFNLISDPREKPANKAYSLTILQRLSEKYPDIKNELVTMVKTQWDNESAAFRSRAKRIIGQG